MPRGLPCWRTCSRGASRPRTARGRRRARLRASWPSSPASRFSRTCASTRGRAAPRAARQPPLLSRSCRLPWRACGRRTRLCGASTWRSLFACGPSASPPGRAADHRPQHPPVHQPGESTSDSAPVRSALALLCGAVLRTFRWGGARQPPAGAPMPQGLQCPHLASIVPCLLKLGKETAQPVRLWMLHGLHLAMQAAPLEFSPFLKETLRLATAHLLADFFESPLVLWTIGELVHSAALIPPTEADVDNPSLREHHTQRILGLWAVLKDMRHADAGSATAFATVRTEALCTLAAQSVIQLAPRAPNQVRCISELLSTKLAPPVRGGSLSAAARAAAVRCITELVGMEECLGQAAPITRDPSQLFALLDGGHPDESEAVRRLVLALVRRRGLRELPVWLQTFKETILALPRGSAPLQTRESAVQESGGGAGRARRRRLHRQAGERSGRGRGEAPAAERRHQGLRGGVSAHAPRAGGPRGRGPLPVRGARGRCGGRRPLRGHGRGRQRRQAGEPPGDPGGSGSARLRLRRAIAGRRRAEAGAAHREPLPPHPRRAGPGRRGGVPAAAGAV
ncbi:unnamed protein product [Prorocentrum cordatum]|uniref:HEAT repeat-containing protein 1 n=1 Tax=Prorocentrum cordatum TaxID=2364126 RepID=A0ABN9U929_9DINO|nr:unnamed protein product [Polarella glacialis]